MKKYNKILLLVLLFIAIQVVAVYAQPGDPGGSPVGLGPRVGDVAAVPLDGGALELLLAGFAVVGFVKIKSWLKRKKEA